MNSILELLLTAHQEIECFEKAIVDELAHPQKLQKDRLIQEHCANSYLEGIQERSKKLLSLYTDENDLWRAELSVMSGPCKIAEFYSRLRTIKDRHRRFPGEKYIPIESTLRIKEKRGEIEKEIEYLFSGEEAYGKYLELHGLFNMYINLKYVPKVNYLKFLSIFDQFHEIPLKTKKLHEYRKYLEEFVKYLEGFIKRRSPLFNYEKLRHDAEESHEKDWQENNVNGWLSKNAGDVVKFCQICELLITNESVYNAHMKSENHRKTEERKIKGDYAKKFKGDTQERGFKYLAKLETIIKAYADHLSIIKEDTYLHTERKQTLTTDELIADNVEEPEVEEEEEEEEERIYNPLKLPMGWDGKPIPYWLYKLHGLGVEYPCEICGNYVYMGRKAFDRHFQEWRHAHGMKCLGIPNTKHFQEITNINDAYALWEKIEADIKKDKNLTETMEEFEDEEGNVFNRKVYEDLKRQGLI